MDHNGEATSLGAGTGLLRIGMFSRLSAISVRMLRYYQEQGVLTPTAVDPFTGHRYYHPDQLVDAHWIVRLRDAGLPVAQIGEAMASRGVPERIQALLSAHAEHLQRERARLEERSAALDRLSRYLKESTMDISVSRIHMPAMTVASLRRLLPSYYDESTLWGEIEPLMQAAGATCPTGEPVLGGATFHDLEYRDSDVDVEVWVKVAAPFAPVPPLECVEVPGRDVVLATLHGGYDGMPEASEVLGSYVAAHNLRTGPMFNIYRVGPAQNPDPTAWVTDVCLPVLAD